MQREHNNTGMFKALKTVIPFTKARQIASIIHANGHKDGTVSFNEDDTLRAVDSNYIGIIPSQVKIVVGWCQLCKLTSKLIISNATRTQQYRIV